MNDISYTSWQNLSDEALEKELGLYLRNIRQQQNRTQEDVANAANISRSTLSLLERGESGNLKTLIQILRVLGKLQVLEVFQFEQPLSPLALAKAQHKPKERVRKSQKREKTLKDKNAYW